VQRVLEFQAKLSMTLFSNITQYSLSLSENGAEYPDLLDYLGFEETGIDTEEEQSPIFEHHLPLDEAITKVRKGELFEGKLGISKNNVDEGIYRFSII
jgi:hypothetical protein